MAGPWVSMAFLCDGIEVDGTRMQTDRVRRSIVRPVASDRQMLVSFDLQFVVVLWPGDLRGPHTLIVRVVPPSGTRSMAMKRRSEFAEHEPVMWFPRMRSTLAELGWWSFDVYVDDDEAPPLTRVPLEVALPGMT